MALIALCSAKGSPGVSVTALAFALTWDRLVILAECDPAGGDIAAGYLRELPLADRGLGQLTASLHRHRLAEDLWSQMVDLAPGADTRMNRLVLPGLADPAAAGGWAQPPSLVQAPGWVQLATLFRSLESGSTGYDVLADCGRLSTAYPPTAVLAAADVVLLVLRPTLPGVRAAATVLAGLRHTAAQVGLIAVGDSPYSPKEVALQLRTPLVAVMPQDPSTAGVLNAGGRRHHGRLLRAASRAQATVMQMVGESRARCDAAVNPGKSTIRREVPSAR